jgi:shikimate kinase
VEIAGVAGSGKSTLARVLSADLGFGVLDDTLRMREPRHFVHVARSLPRLATMSRRWIGAGRRPSWTELKLLIYLMEWDSRLAAAANRGGGVTLLDQGPVYALARLGHVDPQVAGTEPHGDWWNAVAADWADCLDVIVWLDAPNEVLRNRVNRRAQGHEVKGTAAAEAATFSDRYRASYETVLAAMERPGGPMVLRYDTSRMRTADIASETIKALAQLQPEPDQPTSGGGQS